MKRFIIPLLIIAAGLLSTANAQVYVHARIPIPLPPVPRIFPPAPAVEVYPQSQPYYDEYGASPVVVAPEVIYGGGRYDRRYYERFHDFHRDRGYYGREER